jgi:hypothetical protein
MNAQRLRGLLCELEDEIQRDVLRARDASTPDDLARVVDVTEADSIYRLDHLSEATVLDWFRERWPSELPVELVMEGLERRGRVVFPDGVAPEDTLAKCIVDPVDGTRGLMYDKRSAWVLAGVAPQRGAETRLSDLIAAAMTELPPAKQRRADQLSAIRGLGRAGLVARRRDLDSGETHAFSPRPSRATDLAGCMGARPRPRSSRTSTSRRGGSSTSCSPVTIAWRATSGRWPSPPSSANRRSSVTPTMRAPP